MRSSFCRACILLALVLSLGLHWTVLQSAAWVSMIVSYSQEGSLSEALEKTFDGEHPCELCRMIDRGTSESPETGDKEIPSAPTKEVAKKIDLFSTRAPSFFFVQTHTVGEDFAPYSVAAMSRTELPAVPPPQAA